MFPPPVVKPQTREPVNSLGFGTPVASRSIDDLLGKIRHRAIRTLRCSIHHVEGLLGARAPPEPSSLHPERPSVARATEAWVANTVLVRSSISLNSD